MNKKLRAPALIILSLLVIAWPAHSRAQEKSSVNGKWKWSNTGPGGGQGMESTLSLTRDADGKLTGKYQGPWGPESDIQDGRIDGDAISFKITRTFRDREFTTAFSGKLEKDAITGKITMDGGDQEREFDWVAERLPEIDPTGLWKWSTAGRNGQARDSWVKLKYAKGQLTGTYMTGRGFTDVKEARLDGKKISFQVDRGWRNQANVSRFEGTLGNDGITGTINFRRGEEDQSTGWKATRDIPEIDPAGVWTWTTRGRGNDGEVESKLTLNLDGDKLSGTMTRGDDAIEIEDARVNGDEISFKTTTQRNDRTMTSTFVGKIDEDTLAGSIVTGGGDWSFRRGWQASRVIPQGDPGGSWVWTTRRGRDGEEMEIKLKLQNTGGNWSGSMTGRGGETGLKDVIFSGNHVSFKVERTFNERTMVSNFRGQVRGDMLVGTSRFGDGEGGWATRWVAKRQKQEPAGSAEAPKPEEPQKDSPGIDVSGAWMVVVPNENGDDFEMKFTFKSEGEGLTGTVSGTDWEINLEKGTISGNCLTFQTNSPDDADTQAVYHTRATVNGGALTGITSVSVDGETRDIRWTGRKE